MAKNRWYDAHEDAFLVRRARRGGFARRPYGRRTLLYRHLAREFTRRFGIRRSWQGIRQRLQWLLRDVPPMS